MSCSAHAATAGAARVPVVVNGVALAHDAISREAQNHPARTPIAAWISAARALVVREVLSEAHLRESEVRPEEREYLKQHALKKPMGVLHVWALGVGVVITGEYFGWNQGLKEGGPLGMLLASIFVCALYMMWVLALSELSVAMPFAGGPLAYGRRAVGPAFGFVMGWSMFLEALFATIGTALATGGYIYFAQRARDPLGDLAEQRIAGLALGIEVLLHHRGRRRHRLSRERGACGKRCPAERNRTRSCSGA